MKSLFVLLALTMGISTAQAQGETQVDPHMATMTCLIKEGGAQTRETVVEHKYDVTVSHSITQFDSAYAKGFVAVSRGYGVVNVTSKDDGHTNSFYGKIGGGNVVGGNLMFGKDGSNWFQVECQ